MPSEEEFCKIAKQELSYDAWGRLRNPATQAAYTPGSEPVLFLARGYTGHEHHYWFGLINMNARLYDPALGRFLSPDPYVQMPDFTQNFNRYSYCLNNPLVYIDQDGEFWWFFTAVFLFFTEPGYQIQKYFLPIAIKIDLRFGTHQKAIGFDVSVGIPKLAPIAGRLEYGKSYFWKNYGNYQGWETRKGWEASAFSGLATYSRTKFEAGEFSQTVGRISLGIPSFLGLDVSNDLFGDGGDRFRTSHVRLNAGPLRVGQALFTGDPGLKKEDRDKEVINGKETYIKSPYGDPDKYRHGTFYFGFGPVEVGWDSEKTRNFFQNLVVHNLIGSPYFKDLSNLPQYRRTRPFIQFGWGPMW